MDQVFICGHPKSGTTLLLALLDRHPELLVFPEESKFLKRILGVPAHQTLDYVLEQTEVHLFASDRSTHVPRKGYRDYASFDFDMFTQELQRRWAHSDHSERALMESTILSYGKVTGQLDRKFWVEKTPWNERYLDKAYKIWEDSVRTIYIVRDPRDNFASYRKKRQIKGRELFVEQFASDWLRSINYWEAYAHKPHRLLVVYEELLKQPKETLQKICAFLQIGWDDILLKPTRNGVFWSGNSMHGEAHDAISTAPIGRYQEQLTQAEISYLEEYLGKYIQRFGWELNTIQDAAKVKAQIAKPQTSPSASTTGEWLSELFQRAKYKIGTFFRGTPQE